MLSLFAAMLVAGLAADAQPDSGLGLYGPLLNIGAVGVICVVLILFARSTVADLRKQRDDCQAKYDDLAEKVMGQYVPAVTDAAKVITEAMAEIRAFREQERRR
jgi:hypothetical protein